MEGSPPALPTKADPTSATPNPVGALSGSKVENHPSHKQAKLHQPVPLDLQQGPRPVTATFFVDNPTELASDRYGFLGVVWYWTAARNMNSYAKHADILGATKAVNGSTNG